MTHIVRLWKGGNGYWQATSTDPKIRRLFGTDTLPTPFSIQVHGDDVRRTIARRNPDATVELWSKRPGEVQDVWIDSAAYWPAV